MNTQENELQKNVEAGKIFSQEDPDAVAYQQIFKALAREPDFHLKDSFADDLVKKVTQEKARSTFREYIWMAAGFVLLLIAFVVAIAFTGFKLNWGFLSGLSNYKGVLLFGAFFIAILHWLDKRAIRGRHTA